MLGQHLAALSHVMAPAIRPSAEFGASVRQSESEPAAMLDGLGDSDTLHVVDGPLAARLEARLDARFAALTEELRSHRADPSPALAMDRIEQVVAEKTSSLFEALKEEISTLGQSRTKAARREIDRVLYMVLGILGGVFAVELWFAMKP